MKRILSLLILSISTSIYAGEYTGKSTIKWIGSIKNNQFVISGDWANKLNCSKLEQGIWYIKSETDNPEEVKAMYSMALSAYMSGKTIELYSHSCEHGSTNGRPQARSIYLPSRRG